MTDYRNCLNYLAEGEETNGRKKKKDGGCILQKIQGREHMAVGNFYLLYHVYADCVCVFICGCIFFICFEFQNDCGIRAYQVYGKRI